MRRLTCGHTACYTLVDASADAISRCICLRVEGALCANETISYSHLDFCVENKIITPCDERSSITPSKYCTDYEKTIRTQSEKQAVLDRINSRRNKVASGEIRSLPSANNMRKLRWSIDLEELAQKWANQCVKGSVPDLKDDCLDITSIGQNVATVYGDAPGLVPQSLVDIWYMELLHINSSVIHQYKPSIESTTTYYDHFTQLIWALTTEVGCSAARFKECVNEGENEKNITVYRLVCNFSPSGNIPNKEVYETGPPCSQCAVHNSCDSIFKYLCPNDEIYNSEEPMTKTEMINSQLYKDSNIKQSKDTEINNDKDKTREDMLDPYDFTSKLGNLSIPAISIPTTTQKTIFLTDGLQVDDLVEILKKKLSTDTVFRNIIGSKNTHNEGELDPNVREFVGQIYTSKIPIAASISTSNEYVNSTLLADLIEAVIFRNSQRNDVITSTESLRAFQSNNPIFPTKIQAALAEVPTNKYFTGHLFIPEEIDTNMKLTTEADYESYVDKNTEIPLSDILSEIESIRKQKVTKDFLSELLETEYVTDSNEANHEVVPETQNPVLATEYVETRKKRHIILDKNNKYRKNILKTTFRYSNDIKSDERDHGYVIKYSKLLKQLAADVNALKLRDKFACGRNMMNKSLSKKTFNYMHILVLLYIVNYLF